MAWRVNFTQHVNTSSDRDTTEAELVHLEHHDGDETYRITVELSRTAAALGIPLNGEEAVREYLDEEAPPTLLIVTSEGVRPAE
jgi:hypothetical protein